MVLLALDDMDKLVISSSIKSSMFWLWGSSSNTEQRKYYRVASVHVRSLLDTQPQSGVSYCELQLNPENINVLET